MDINFRSEIYYDYDHSYVFPAFDWKFNVSEVFYIDFHLFMYVWSYYVYIVIFS
jgi:hypothetical protein